MSAFCMSFRIIITPCGTAFASPWKKIQKMTLRKKFAYMNFGTSIGVIGLYFSLLLESCIKGPVYFFKDSLEQERRLWVQSIKLSVQSEQRETYHRVRRKGDWI